jgi:trk system potassium uptake protein TrkH
VLVTSALLIVLGFLVVWFADGGGVLHGLSRQGRVLTALFQSVSTRTAGFNTCGIGALSAATLWVMIGLMFIGASPGSTGGGIKTTTLTVLAATVFDGLRQREDTELCRRTIPAEAIRKAVTLLCLSLAGVACFTFALLVTERAPLLDVLFETVSAFGTVGLSTGLTPKLTTAGRLLVTLLMLVGRLGPLTVAYAILVFRRRVNYTYAEERIMIG